MIKARLYTILLFTFIQLGIPALSQNDFELNIALAEKAYKSNKFDSSLYYAQYAERFVSNPADFHSKSLSLVWQGKSNMAMHQFEIADDLFEKAIEAAVLSRDTLMIANCYSDLGRTYRKRSLYARSMSAFNAALKYYYLLDHKPGIAQVHLNIGNIFKAIGKNELAKIEYHKALAIFKQINDEQNEAGCYNNLGNIFKNEQSYDSAFFYMYKTLLIRERNDALIPRAYIYHNLANLHLAINNTDSALFYITKSLHINDSLNAVLDIASDYNVIGSIYIALNDWNKAVEYLEKSYELEKSNAISENKLDVLRQLGFVYYKKGNTQKSADYFIEFFRENDSLLSSNQNSFIQSELIQYEYFSDSLQIEQLELQRDLENVKQENLILAQKINTRNYIFIIILLILLISIGTILYYITQKNLNKTKEHEAILARQNEELKRTLISKEEKEILLKEVHHRVKNNLQIINSLIRLQSNFMNAKNFKEKLIETENRIRSMALIHEKLYKTGNLASLSVRNYIEELAFNILESYENHNVKIKLKFDIEEKEYGIDMLIPMGLILNEVLSNSIKHAFYERTEGNVFISIKSDDKKSYLTIMDDGIGADLTYEELKEDSLGMELIDSLTGQLDGTLALKTENGFEYNFVFSLRA